MATPSTSETPAATPAPRKYNLRNPLPLSASQEQEVKLLYYKRVRSHCAPEIKGMYPLLARLYVAFLGSRNTQSPCKPWSIFHLNRGREPPTCILKIDILLTSNHSIRRMRRQPNRHCNMDLSHAASRYELLHGRPCQPRRRRSRT